MTAPAGGQLAPDMVGHWRPILESEVEDLDFTDPDDRALFRLRVLYRTPRTRVDLIRALARAFGATDVPMSRSGAVRALADAFVAQR